MSNTPTTEQAQRVDQFGQEYRRAVASGATARSDAEQALRDQAQELSWLLRSFAKQLHREHNHDGVLNRCNNEDCMMMRTAIADAASKFWKQGETK